MVDISIQFAENGYILEFSQSERRIFKKEEKNELIREIEGKLEHLFKLWEEKNARLSDI